MDVHQTRNRSHPRAKILRDDEVLRPVVSDGSYVNLRRNAEIEDLRGDIGGLEIENLLRKGGRKRLPQFLDIIGCRRVPLLERHQDHPVVDADRRPIHERVIVSARRQADIVDDHIAVAFRDDLANLVLDRLEYLRRRLNARSWGSAHVQLDLAGVDRGKEIAPDEGEQHGAEYQNQSRYGRQDKSVSHQSSEQIGVAGAKMLEPPVKPGVEAREQAARSVRFAVMLALQE